MRFTNENGDTMNLADNLTLHELLDMGVSISVCEETDRISRSGWRSRKRITDPLPGLRAHPGGGLIFPFRAVVTA